MITIINYGLGNIKAFINVYNRLNIQIKVANSVEDLSDATKIILPGVGAFDQAMILLENSGMREKLDELVLENKMPIIGICVGMQIMAKSSEEGVLPGLGWFEGTVKKFDTTKLMHKPHLPHMGWNAVKLMENDAIFCELELNPRYYFLHSYYFACKNSNNVLATAEYGENFTCVIKKDNIYGVQFHPEKSHHNGVQILKNFGNL